MSYARMKMIYPGESSSVNQEESAPAGDPGCAGKITATGWQPNCSWQIYQYQIILFKFMSRHCH